MSTFATSIQSNTVTPKITAAAGEASLFKCLRRMYQAPISKFHIQDKSISLFRGIHFTRSGLESLSRKIFSALLWASIALQPLAPPPHSRTIRNFSPTEKLWLYPRCIYT